MITYFIQSGDFVKIGRTSNLQKRVNQLRVAFPQDPILLNACDMPEKVAHKIAGEISNRKNGEWFEVNPSLLEWIFAIETTTNEMAAFVLKKRTPKGMRIKGGKVGRPATGITKVKPSITMDLNVEKMGKEAALTEGISFSSWVENAVKKHLHTITNSDEQ